ncbi:glycosyltransferase family protein [Bacillus pfraonensis]|uniref:glycosyltransferase family protein n=1 Tax=Bacillus pfraonensis TaxID=2830844 RepID=UPI003D6FE32E
MNSKKISFISCVNNFEEYNTALHYIHSLKIPPNYEIETIAIQKASSMTSGYNEAMKKSDAKYKVYLHQDAYILNENFISDVITLFEKYPKLGILGVLGAKTLPNGYIIHSFHIYGIMYHTLKGKGNIELTSARNVINDYEKVLVIDGVIMVTQYDLVWREDLFQGWHFYDASQSLEFIKAGYEVGVVKQESPWCFHDTGIIDWTGYEENRNIFVQNYRDYII